MTEMRNEYEKDLCKITEVSMNGHKLQAQWGHYVSSRNRNMIQGGNFVEEEEESPGIEDKRG